LKFIAEFVQDLGFTKKIASIPRGTRIARRIMIAAAPSRGESCNERPPRLFTWQLS
jgi:hypothetical protein